MNKVIIVGNVSRDIESSTTNSGVKVVKFGVAVQRRFKNANGEYETDFLNCVAWRSVGELCEKYLSKGSKVGISGSIQNRSYEAQDGSKRYVTEIIADEVEFLTPKGASENSSNDNSDLKPVEDDGLPF